MVSRSPPSTCPSDASCGAEPSAAHTPGPWVCGLNRHGNRYLVSGKKIVAGADWNSFGSPLFPPKDEAFANGRLMAAAPDMLAALILVTAGADDISEYTTLSGDHVLRAVHLKMARAAIAKALGQ
jgi:hypothetical protein